VKKIYLQDDDKIVIEDEQYIRVYFPTKNETVDIIAKKLVCLTEPTFQALMPKKVLTEAGILGWLKLWWKVKIKKRSL